MPTIIEVKFKISGVTNTELDSHQLILHTQENFAKSYMEQVILVDENDTKLGSMEKLEAHRKGLLHRAISVFIFNDNNELLLQKRAAGKYHSANLWTNTCCSHPRPEEEVDMAARRRLNEEMGINVNLNWCFKFQYKTQFDNGLVESEMDHVFIGKFNAIPKPNPEEVSDWKYMSIDSILADIEVNPDKYTFWFKHIIRRVAQHYSNL